MKRGSGIALLAAGAVGFTGLGVVADHALLAWKARAATIAARAAPWTGPRYQHRVSLFEGLTTRPDVVMLGDSLTQGAEWSELIGPQVANRGIGSDTSGGLLRRLDASVPASARTVAIMIGTNDLTVADWKVETSVGNVSAMLDHLKGRRIILQSVLYTAKPADNVRIRALNDGYARLCATGRCEWLNLNPAVAPTGVLTRDASLDGRHLTGPAYQRWTKALKARLG